MKNAVSTLAVTFLAIVAGRISLIQQSLFNSIAVSIPFLYVSIIIGKHLAKDEKPGSWIMCFIFVWAVSWTFFYNFQLTP